jgi:dihydrofolate reductase
MPKYVVSSTIERPRWTSSSNSTVLKGDVVVEVSKLRHEIEGEIVIFASTQLVHTLIEHDLVDQLRLMVYPVVAGAGKAPPRRDQRHEAAAPRQQPVGDNLASL